MLRLAALADEKTIRRLFEVSLWLKALFALTEVLGGIAAYFLSHALLVHIANVITQGELTEDPTDLVANYLLHATERLSISSQHFAALYLFGHGIIKLWLVIGLLRQRLWFYPTALVAFTLFIVYQLYRFVFTHSFLLLVVTAVDLIVVALTWHEFKYLRKMKVRAQHNRNDR